jgi:hypothetical protein
MPLRVGVIVEGQGEYQGIRTLLERVWYELFRGDFIDVLRPWRWKQGILLTETGLKEAVDAVKIVLDRYPPDGLHKLVLILIDSEGKPPCILAPQLLKWAREARGDADIACVLPHPMFETWFAAAAASLAGVNGLPTDLPIPVDAEAEGKGKAWIKSLLPQSRSYKETVDQVRFAAKMDLALCRGRFRSFDKLCRELEQRLRPPPQSPPVEEGPAPVEE